MSNFQVLDDAFAELERRADAASLSRDAEFTSRAPAHSRHRLALVAASVVGVAAVAAGGALLAGSGGGSSNDAAAPPVLLAKSSPAAMPFQIPRTPAELARRFRIVLGGTATFTVTDTGTPVRMRVPSAPPSGGRIGSATTRHRPGNSTSVPPAEPNGAAIVGTLSAGGLTGGYDLQIFRATVGTTAMCDDPDRATCTVRAFAGGSLAVAEETLPTSRTGVTYLVDYVRADGAEFLMHVSNERSPKGDSVLLADRPPLTTDQMTAIVTSDRW